MTKRELLEKIEWQYHHILHLEMANNKLLRRILKEEGHPESATLTFQNSQGETLMPASIVVGQTATAVFTEFSGLNGSGSVVAPVGAVSFASDNPSVATVDPVSGIATGVSAGTANISGADAGSQLTASDVLTVGAAAPSGAQSATLVLTANPLPSSAFRR